MLERGEGKDWFHFLSIRGEGAKGVERPVGLEMRSALLMECRGD